MGRPRIIHGALVAALAATACSSGTSSTAPPSSPAAPSRSAAIPSTTPARTLALGTCVGAVPAAARCGALTVPLDYADPSKGTLDLAVISLPAQNRAQRIGSLVVNPGGPGASGVQFVENSTELFSTLNARFDIVGFDPRGTNDPAPVACESSAQLDRLVAADPIVDDPAERQELVSTNQQLAQACAQKSGQLLPYVGTDNVARDLDALRAALDDAALTYLGISYGTSIGTRYAALFPTHVRALVLDGDIDPSQSLFDLVTQQADGLETSYSEFIAQCKTVHSCPLGPDPGGVITKLLSDLDAHPVVAADSRSVGRGIALNALAIAMYEPTAWDSIYSVFAAAAAGNVSGLLTLNDLVSGRQNGVFDHQLESNAAVNCADYSAPTDIGAYDTAAQQLQARDPHFGASAIYGSLTCAYWAVHGGAAKPLDVVGAPPILLVGATKDPVTPYAWSQSLQRQIQGSVLLTRDGFGHSSFNKSPCIAAKVEAYLVDLTVPAGGTTCAS